MKSEIRSERTPSGAASVTLPTVNLPRITSNFKPIYGHGFMALMIELLQERKDHSVSHVLLR
jgi:hypothetical protein